MTFGFILALLGGFTVLQACFPLPYLPADFLLMYVIFLGMQRGRGSGFLAGLAGGFMMDLLAGPRLGLFTAAKGLTGALADTLHLGANREDPRTQVLAFAALTLVHDGLVAGLGRLWGLNQGGIRQVVAVYILPKCLLHALLAIPFFWVLQKVVRRRVIRNKRAQAPRIIRSWPH